jgi:citrate lyase synthetase
MEGVLSDDPVSQLAEDLPAREYDVRLKQLETAHLGISLQLDLLDREQAHLKEAHAAIAGEMTVQNKVNALRKLVPGPTAFQFARNNAEMIARDDPVMHAKALEAWKRKRARAVPGSNASSDS